MRKIESVASFPMQKFREEVTERGPYNVRESIATSDQKSSFQRTETTGKRTRTSVVRGRCDSSYFLTMCRRVKNKLLAHWKSNTFLNKCYVRWCLGAIISFHQFPLVLLLLLPPVLSLLGACVSLATKMKNFKFMKINCSSAMCNVPVIHCSSKVLYDGDAGLVGDWLASLSYLAACCSCTKLWIYFLYVDEMKWRNGSGAGCLSVCTNTSHYIP